MWKDNNRRHTERTATLEVIRTYGADHKIIFVGDATMSPYEIVHPGGSIEHWNEESGAVWIQRIVNHYPHTIWLNPEHMTPWNLTESTLITKQLMQDRMYPLTLEGLDSGMRELHRKHQ